MMTTSGEETVLEQAAVEKFEAGLRGALLRPTDEGYEEARAIWNGMIDKKPALIVRCTGAADVIDAVRFARTHSLLVSVRGGGHNVSGNAVCDGGLMIDLSLMKAVWVDPEAGTTRVQGGATWGDVDREAQAFGLAVPGGIVSTTGVAGLTLGGGIGWIQRKHGLTCDNLLSVDFVTADGEFLTASPDQNPDLFWGLRGGGGNFGIVTSFEFRLHLLGPIVIAGMVLHPMEKAREVLEFYRDYISDAPEELTAVPVLRIAPPAPFLPEEIHGQPVSGIAVCYAGAVEEAGPVVQPVKEFGAPQADLIVPKPFMAHQIMFDATSPPGWNYYLKSEYLSDLSDGAIDIIAEHAARITSPQTVIPAFHLGGAIQRTDDDETAVGHRDAGWALNIQAAWTEPDGSEKHIEWTREFWKTLQPFSAGGAYINFQSGDEGEDRVRAAYGETTYQRLVALKNQYDPSNFFRLNQNIKPTV
ncbi:MAG: FAD-binding oxidoreductase [Anaerolineae bacterium]